MSKGIEGKNSGMRPTPVHDDAVRIPTFLLLTPHFSLLTFFHQ